MKKTLAWLLPLAALACGRPTEATDSDHSDIVDIDNTRIKKQSIGNCWQYAIAGWVESLAKSARPESPDMDVSESYWAYWFWFDQLVAGQPLAELETGGYYTTGAEIIRRYGVMEEGTFIPAEAGAEMSGRQKTALAKLNASLANGPLSNATARRDRAFVRRQLDQAFELVPSVVRQLDTVFGPAVERTLLTSGVDTSATQIRRPETIPALLRDPHTHEPALRSLADALGRPSGTWGRVGYYAWQNEESYPTDANARRKMLIRVQRALHDRQPVIMSWYVDFNAVDAMDRFLAPPERPGRQGAHMTVIEDYQAQVPGFGTLLAGVDEQRPEALAAALAPGASIEFFRIKNSWGVRPDNPYVFPGYYDLYMRYLDGPIWRCTQTATGSTDDCWLGAALMDFVVPQGY